MKNEKTKDYGVKCARAHIIFVIEHIYIQLNPYLVSL